MKHELPFELMLGIFTIIERKSPNLIFRKHQDKVIFYFFKTSIEKDITHIISTLMEKKVYM